MTPTHRLRSPLLSGVPRHRRRLLLILANTALLLPLAHPQESTPESAADPLAASTPRTVIGAQECAECHSAEEKVWKTSSHFRSNETHRDPRTRNTAFDIASRMGIFARDIPTHARCAGCHATVQETRQGILRAIGGASCESCHGGGLDYIDVHGEKKDFPNREERRALSIAGGMHYPHEIHKIAATCFQCHIVQDEELVNVGGHPARSSGFNLLSWTQGEVRHNFYDDEMNRDSKFNRPASPARRRQIFVTGLLLDLECSLRALAVGQQRGNEYPYRQAMGQRAYAIIHTELPALAEACGGAEHCPKQILAILKIGAKTDLTGPSIAVLQSADAIKAQIVDFCENGPRVLSGAIDALIPDQPRGSVFTP